MSSPPPQLSVSAPSAGLPLRANAAANLACHIATLLIAFWVSPILVRGLGDGRYGVWSLIAELTGYASLLDLGLRGAVSYFVSRYATQGDDVHTRNSMASAFWFLAGLGAVAAIAGTALAALFPTLFRTGGLDPREIFISMAVLSLTMGLTLPMAVPWSVMSGYRQVALLNVTDVAVRLITAFATVAVLRSGGLLIEVSLVTLSGRLVSWSIQWVIARIRVPILTVAPRWCSRAALREMFAYGSRNLVIAIANTVINRTDLLVISAVIGVAMVTPYTLGAMLVLSGVGLIVSVTSTYMPYLSARHAAGEDALLRRDYLEGTRSAALLVNVLFAGMAVFGGPFLSQWVGEKYSLGDWTRRADVVVLILIAAQYPSMLQSISRQLLLGTGRNRFLMRLQLAEAAANITLSLILARHFGIAGVALGTLFPMLAVNCIAMPIYLRHVIGPGIFASYLRALAPGALAGAATLLTGLAAVRLFPPHSWPTLLAPASAAALAGAAVSWRFLPRKH